MRTPLVLASVVVLVLLAAGGAAVAFWPSGGSPSGTQQVAADATAESGAAGGGPAGEPSPSGSVDPREGVGPGQGRPLPSSAAPSGSTSAKAVPTGDEFNGTAVDTSLWGVYNSVNSYGGAWKPSAVKVGGGFLSITGTGRNPTGAGNVAGGLCWCGGGGNRVYGKWQLRARIDPGAGYAQTIALWPESDKPADGGVVIAAVSLPDRSAMHTTVRWSDSKYDVRVPGDFTVWHTYTVEWRAGFVKTWIDDKLVLDTTTKPGTVIPSKPMHLIMQQPIGPSDGVPVATTATPDRVVMQIDWVRYTP